MSVLGVLFVQTMNVSAIVSLSLSTSRSTQAPPPFSLSLHLSPPLSPPLCLTVYLSLSFHLLCSYFSSQSRTCCSHHESKLAMNQIQLTSLSFSCDFSSTSSIESIQAMKWFSCLQRKVLKGFLIKMIYQALYYFS